MSCELLATLFKKFPPKVDGDYGRSFGEIAPFPPNVIGYSGVLATPPPPPVFAIWGMDDYRVYDYDPSPVELNPLVAVILTVDPILLLSLNAFICLQNKSSNLLP